MELKLRLPEGLGEALKASAESRGFSVNSEVTRRIGLSFEMETREAAQQQLINRLTEQLGDTQKRLNGLTDYVLALTSPKVPASEAVYGPGAPGSKSEDAA